MQYKFGDFIRFIRGSKSMSLREISEHLQISPSYISDIEKGNRNPPGIEILHKISKLYNLTKDEVILMFNLAAEETKTCPSDILDAVYKLDENIRVKVWNEIRMLLKS